MNVNRYNLSCSDRYEFDFDRCPSRDGWAQVDTGSDAWYYGNWANPWLLKIISYAEGDVTEMQAETVEEFVKEIRSEQAWHMENSGKFQIDGMCRPEIINRFTDIGLADVLY